jgi:hypothetical protein
MKTGSSIILGLVAWALMARGEGVPRVALMEFGTDDNSYQSARAAADFSGILQASLGGETNLAWVERVQLDKARQELETAAGGLEGDDMTIRRGKWVGADWMVTGLISEDDRNQRTLSVEITDLKHADTLVSGTITFPGLAAEPFQIGSNMVEEATGKLRGLLVDARQEDQESEGKVLVAPLFMANISGTFGRMTFKEPLGDEFDEILGRVAATNSRVRLIRFPKAYRSTDESEMVLGGLVDADPNAWQQTADLYVWGTYEVSPPRVPNAMRKIELTLHL